jgi:hypothetical protein
MAASRPAEQILQHLGFSSSDAMHLPTSAGAFSDGADYRIEIPSVNSIATFESLVDRATENGLTINRVTETLGLFRHTRSEVQSYIALAKSHGIELFMSVGPRATYDTSPSRLSDQGRLLGYRLRGLDQVSRALDDVLRGLDLGCINFVVYDEGLLYILDHARQSQYIPPETQFKASAHLGYANPASLRLLEQLGANSINPIRDLPLAAIASIRHHVTVPLDLHTDNPASSGGFIRTMEAAEMVRVARPVHLKTGNSILGSHGQFTGRSDGMRMADQAAITVEMVERFASQFRQSAVDDVPLETL